MKQGFVVLLGKIDLQIKNALIITVKKESQYNPASIVLHDTQNWSVICIRFGIDICCSE